MATNKNTDFLHFNAYSIHELIKRKLTEDNNFTDQIYPGSNLNILIDLVAYMYQCLMYNLNHTAAESMFSDTRIYENISRLVKFIGYNPKGLVPSVGTFYFDNENGKYANQYILKYSSIDTKQTDQYGNPIKFSTIEDIHIDSTNSQKYYTFRMYNGVWKMYSKVFTSSGEDFETLTLDRIGSTIQSYTIDKQVANNCVDVYVEHQVLQLDGTSKSQMTKYKVIDTELFTNNRYDQNVTSYSKIYTSDDPVVSLRLKEDKTYELKFGDGVVGKKPNKGDQIYIMYLATNGNDGVLDLDSYNDSIPNLEHDAAQFGMTQHLYDLIFQSNQQAIVSTNAKNTNPVPIYLYENTTTPIAEESVDDIRANAPEWFKMGQRLVTAADYTYYVKNLRRSEVDDCYVMNNYEYAASFYKWLYDLGIQNHANEGGEYYYLNQDTLLKNNVNWVDPVDINNVYIWVKMDDNTSIQNLKTSYLNDMQRIKCMTQNIIFLDAINVNFSVCGIRVETLKDMIKNGTYQSGEYLNNYESFIEVTVNNNCSFASSTLAEQINNIIKSYFDSKTMKLGQVVNFNEILDKVYAIPGVQKIRTVCSRKSDNQVVSSIDGISFATWSASMIDAGEDLEVSNIARAIEKFQFPIFFDTNLTKRVKVIRKSINSGVRIQY